MKKYGSSLNGHIWADSFLFLCLSDAVVVPDDTILYMQLRCHVGKMWQHCEGARGFKWSEATTRSNYDRETPFQLEFRHLASSSAEIKEIKDINRF